MKVFTIKNFYFLIILRFQITKQISVTFQKNLDITMKFDSSKLSFG